MIKFKAFVILEFQSDCIKNAKSKLEEIIQEIKEEVPYITNITIDESRDKLFIN